MLLILLNLWAELINKHTLVGKPFTLLGAVSFCFYGSVFISSLLSVLLHIFPDISQHVENAL